MTEERIRQALGKDTIDFDDSYDEEDVIDLRCASPEIMSQLLKT